MENKLDKNEQASKNDDAEDEISPEYVKSRAVVKYSSVNMPAHFEELKFDTDLKLPPSNWLRSSTKCYGLHHGLFKSNGFTSFRLAHMFSDCLGDVDVVSDAENIKKLLKIPYNKAPVSMMVHRIENTLLIDEFDIHKHLLEQAETDWQWLRKFFFENIIQSLKGNTFSIGPRSRSALQQKSLVSKFLHYSFKTENENEVAHEPDPSSQTPPPDALICQTNEIFPDADVCAELPDAGNEYKFVRNVVWTFEDIQMLLGTDMPIFGGGTHPCISLRLRDIEKPISVLTGIDYWLDNLMSNVPEVVMCYHLDGIVKKYELIKTEDLPDLPNAKFSPKLIRDVAQNILSFLKTNATKAGHTYWLFKARNDDVVKLYDLTSLCSDSLIDKEQNPFTVPVGLLLYRVARNMKQSSDKSNLQPSTIRMLLKNCIALLPKEKYPQIVTSAHYMLADIYIPDDTDPKSPQLIDETAVVDPEVADEEDDEITQVQVKSLCLAYHSTVRESKYQPPPLVGSVMDRCMLALSHITEGLHCLPYFNTKNSAESEGNEHEEPQMAKSSEPIPMSYSKLNPSQDDKNTLAKVPDDVKGNQSKKVVTSPKALVCRPKAEPIPTWQKTDKMDTMGWKDHLEYLLTNKAVLVYQTLVEQHFSSASYGLTLKYISYLLDLCQQPNLVGHLLKRAGDSLLYLTKDWANVEKHSNDFTENYQLLPTGLRKSDAALIPHDFNDPREVLLASKACYLKAKKLLPNNEKLIKRIGNIHNEISTYTLNKAYELFVQKPSSSAKLKSLLNEAEQEMKEGIKIFEKVKDIENLSLLYSNTGRLIRTKAHCLGEESEESFKLAEKYYLKALKNLGTRSEHFNIWDLVNWELSTLLFTFATSIQDDSDLLDPSTNKNDRDVIQHLTRALKYCDLTTPGPRLPLYQYRAAIIHKKIASNYNKQYMANLVSGPLMSEQENRLKYILKLALNHYAKASELLCGLECSYDLFCLLFERVLFYKNVAEECPNNALKIKYLQNALSLIIEMRPQFVELEGTSDLSPGSDTAQSEKLLKEIKDLSFDDILCNILKDLTVLNLKNKQPQSAVYKEAYSTLLKRDSGSSLPKVCLQVIDILQETKTKQVMRK